MIEKLFAAIAVFFAGAWLSRLFTKKTTVKVEAKTGGQVLDESPVGEQIETESDEEAMSRFMGGE